MMNNSKLIAILKSDHIVDRSLTHFGLFTKELTAFLREKEFDYSNLTFKINSSDVDSLIGSVMGRRRIIEATGSISRERRTYPGPRIFYFNDRYGLYSGYARLFYEDMDTKYKKGVAKTLLAIYENPGATISEINHASGRVSEVVQRLTAKGFVRRENRRFYPTNITQSIFSKEVQDAWKEFRGEKEDRSDGWKHGIDVWE